MMLRSALRCAAALAFSTLAFAAAPAAAEEGDGWLLTLGGGAAVGPKYPGADNYGIGPLPIIDFRREGSPLPFHAPDQGGGFGFLGRDSAFNFGPSVRFRYKREDDDVGAAVGDVGFTIEAGAFAEAYLGDHFRLRGEGRRGLGGHDGWVGDVMADFVLRHRDTYVFSIGPRARWADDNFHDAYFSVTPAVAAATGLPAYNAGSGFHEVGLYSSLTYMLDRRWGVYGYAGYDRLIGDAADSPIVTAFGSRNQYSGGIGLFYNFNVGRASSR
jgi:outer membrane protein